MHKIATIRCTAMQQIELLKTLSVVAVLLLTTTPVSLSLKCFCTEGTSGCSNGVCEVTTPKAYCETQVKYDANDDENPLEAVIAMCVKNINTFVPTYSTCNGDTGSTWEDDSHPQYKFKNYCCSNADFCNDCPPKELLDIPGVISFLPSSCKLPDDVHTESTTSTMPVPNFEPSTPTEKVLSVVETESEPSSPPEVNNNNMDGHFKIVTLVLTGCIVVSGALMFVLIFSLYLKWRSGKERDNFMKKCPSLMEEAPFTFSVEYSISSSGMNGARLLQQRTLGDDICKIRRLGRGSFGDVWLGDWLGEEVAVKVFHTRAEESWRREEEIYRTHMLTHDNILRFKTAEQRTYLDSHIELWTIFEYHPNGTLYEYLEENSLGMQDALKLCASFISGLHYLHKDIQAATCQAKPGIAHRDLKSRNILVKADGACTIADLGLAVKHDGRGGVDRIPSNKLQGTRRYMPPEILNQTMNFSSFLCYKRADIYSASLILYEILSCVKFSKAAINKHTLPYNNHLPSDPTIEEVRDVVCAGIRPDLGFLGNKQSLSASFTTFLQEGWHQDPAVRPTASYMNKRVSSMQK